MTVVSSDAASREQVRPRPLAVQSNNIPEALRRLDHWVIWRYEQRGGKWTKVPYQPNGRHASSTDPDTWSSFNQALLAARADGSDGIGFCVTGSGVVGVDLDHCRNAGTGELEPWARDIVAALDSYTEVSPSGTGIRVFVEATFNSPTKRKGDVEIYAEDRYLTVTGHVVGSHGNAGVEARQKGLDTVVAKYLAPVKSLPAPAQSGSIDRPPAAAQPVWLRARVTLRMHESMWFRDLYRGDWQTRYTSQSEADLALAGELMRLADGDTSLTNLLFRRSGLYREKWERNSYREHTLRRASEGTSIISSEPKTFSIETLPSVWQLDAKIEWAVEGLIPRKAITMLTGDSGVGKSTFALALSSAVANGTRFLGRDAAQMPVLYIDRENPLAIVRERLDRLGIAETQQMRFWGGWCAVQPEGPAAPRIQKYAGECAPLIIFDSLVAFHEGSEQDASETRRFMAGFRALAYAGATVLLIHHTGKAASAKDYRGSSDLKAAVDIAWLLEASGNVNGLGQARLVPFKNRMGTSQALSIEYTNHRYRACHPAPTVRQVIETILKKRPGIGQKELVDEIRARDVARDVAREAIAAAVRDGWLTEQSSGKGGKRTYTLPGGTGTFPAD